MLSQQLPTLSWPLTSDLSNLAFLSSLKETLNHQQSLAILHQIMDFFQ